MRKIYNHKTFLMPLLKNHQPLIVKRTMFTRAKAMTNKVLTSNLPFVNNKTCLSNNNYSTLSPVKIKPFSAAAKDLASDDTGIHPHILEETCIKTNCEKLKCKILCDSPNEVINKGHLTHKPPKGKLYKFISHYDAEGKLLTQYWVKNPNRPKCIKATKAQSYFQSKQLKKNSKLDQYINKPDVQINLDD